MPPPHLLFVASLQDIDIHEHRSEENNAEVTPPLESPVKINGVYEKHPLLTLGIEGYLYICTVVSLLLA
jgi:hypothetical protein